MWGQVLAALYLSIKNRTGSSLAAVAGVAFYALAPATIMLFIILLLVGVGK